MVVLVRVQCLCQERFASSCLRPFDHELKPIDHAERREFFEWIMEQQQVDVDFSSHMIFSDEAHFHLNGYVNRQIVAFWGS